MSPSPSVRRGSLARVLTVARAQWKLALRPPPELSGHDKLVLGALLIPLLAFVALALGFLGYMAGSRLSAEPLYLHYLLVGLAALLLFVAGLSAPFADKSLSGFETSRLFHLPIRPGEILASQVLGNVLNPGVVLIPGAFILGCSAGSLRAGLPSLSLRCLLAGLLWLVQLGLVVMVTDYALLYLRRLRTLRRAASLLALLVMAGSLWLLDKSSHAMDSDKAASTFAPVQQLLRPLWESCEPLLGFVPGISPLAWVTMRPGWWAILAVSIAETVLLFAAGARLLDGMLSGRVVEEASPGKKPRRGAGSRRAGVLERLPIWPFLTKDLRLLVREKNVWISLFGIGVLIVTVPQLLLEFASNRADTPAGFSAPLQEWAGPLSALATVMLLGSFTLNQLGLEGPAIQLLLASPAPRWRYLAGKNLALFLMAAAIMTCAEAGFLLRQARWSSIVADCVFFASLQAAYLAAGNVASVLWPYPASVSGKATGTKASQITILLASLYQLVLVLLFGYAALPLLSGRLAMAFLGPHAWPYWAVAACMLLYGGLFYGLVLAGAARLLQHLEPRVFERLVRL